MNSTDKLSSLRRSRDRASGRRRAGPLLVLLAFVVGMAGLFAMIFGDLIRPRIPVSTEPAILLETGDAEMGDAVEEPGRMIAQASGWIEPDPYPVRVPVKTDGFVETVHVLEGQAVRAGDLLASLDPTNLVLRVERLAAGHIEAVAALAAQEEAVRLAEAMVRKAAAALEAAKARQEEAADRSGRIRSLTDADVSPVERIAADRAEAEQTAAYENAQADLTAARIEAAAASHRVQEMQARVARLDAEYTQANVDLERTRVLAPMNGVVLALHAAPGMKRMTGMDDPDSATIVTLYDPARLQVRVDVPLSEAGRIETGMTARIITAAFPNRVFTGTVTRITGEADITRNTLQMKVAIRDPDPRMRPEMLCRAEFLGRAGSGGDRANRGSRMLWIPATAIVSEGDGTARVWVVDPVEETAQPRDIVPGGAGKEGLRPVREGLKAGERVVVRGTDRLKPGVRVKIREGETS